MEFIVSSEESGFRHLYLVLATFVPQIPESQEEVFRRVRLQPQILKKVPITSGEWSVSDQQIEVDPLRRLVFFHGYKDTPIEKHGYVVSFFDIKKMEILQKIFRYRTLSKKNRLTIYAVMIFLKNNI